MTSWPNGSKTIPRVTSEFGPREPIPGVSSSTFHSGIDLIGWANNKSPVDGVVILAAYNGGAGNEVRIRGDNGDVFRILHNARFLVGYGERVSEGQDVGVMGTTGDSTGVHCHFETKPGGGAAVNPRGYMAAHGTTPAGGDITPITESDDMTDRLIRTPDGSIGLAAGDGDFLPLSSMNEVETLRATTLPNPEWIQLPDRNIWDTRVALAARKQLAKSSDPTAIAQTVAGLLIPAVVAGLKGQVGLTEADVRRATETAMRSVFGDAATA